jgi:hypothetical protein
LIECWTLCAMLTLLCRRTEATAELNIYVARTSAER